MSKDFAYHAKNATENLDQQIEVIHKSGRTTFKSFEKIHNYYRAVSKKYYNWHLKPYSSKVHVYVLALFALAALITSFYIVNPFGPIKTKAAGSTYYVDAASSCISACGSISQPFKTIQAAVNAASAGDTLNVKAGTYDERVTISKTGTSGSPIVMQGQGTDRPVVTKGFVFSGSYITVKQFSISSGDTSETIGTAIKFSGDHNTANDVLMDHVRPNIGSAYSEVNGGGRNFFIVMLSGSYNSTINCRVLSYWGTAVGWGGDHNEWHGGEIYADWDYWNVREWGQAGGTDNGVYDTIMHGPAYSGGLEAFDYYTNTDQGFKNFTIKNDKLYDLYRLNGSSQHTALIGFYRGIDGLYIDGCSLGSKRAGTFFTGPDGNSYYADDGSQGTIWLGGNATNAIWKNVSVKNSIIMGATQQYYWIQTSPDNGTTVQGFTFVNNIVHSGTGTMFYGASGNFVWENNIWLAGSGYGTPAGATNISKNNMFVAQAAASGTGNFRTDVALGSIFINPDISVTTYQGVNADWHLKVGSPAINAGISTASDANVPLLDADGNSRVDATEVGPYEYTADLNSIYVTKTGNDSTGDGTQTKPYLTIQKAASVVTAGKTVYVSAGTYNERVTISKTASSGSPIVIRGQGTDRPIVTQGFAESGQYTTVKQFEITPGGSSTALSVSGTNNMADDINVHDINYQTGMSVSGSGSQIINSSLNTWAPYDVTRYPSGVIVGSNGTFKNNHVEAGSLGTSSAGAEVDGTNATVEGNEFVGPFEDMAIHLFASNSLIKNNKLYMTGTKGGVHTETLGIGGNSQTPTVTNDTITGNIFANPEGGWTDSGGDSWSGAPFHIFFFATAPWTLDGFTFSNNIFLGGVSRAMDLNAECPTDQDYPSNVRFYNNVFDGGPSAGLMAYSTWRNNIFGNSAPPVAADVGAYPARSCSPQNTPISIDYSLYSGTKADSGTHSISGQPNFAWKIQGKSISPANRNGLDLDWSLSAGSAAINAGLSTASDANVPLLDKAGLPRVGATDIGAYEYQGAVTTYTVTGTASPLAGGSVTGGGTVNSGSSTTLTATANTGYTFSAWSGDCSGSTNPYTLSNVTANKACTATFTLNTYSLTTAVSPAGAGSVTGVANPYNYNTVASITAVPATRYQFSSWSGNCSGTNAATTVTMTSAKSCTANFVTIPVSLMNTTFVATQSTISIPGSTNITLTLKDSSGNNIQGHTIQFSSDQGGMDTVNPTSAVTNSSGVATTNISSVLAHTSVITASDQTETPGTNKWTANLTFTAGNIYYVATTGNDSNAGTLAAPWKTIQKAANTVTAGGYVYVKAGTYDERVTISKTATSVSPIFIQGQGTDRPVVTNGFAVTGHYINVKQFEVTVGNAVDQGQAATISGTYNIVDDITASALRQHDTTSCNCNNDPGNPTYQFILGGSYNTLKNSHDIDSWGSGISIDGDHNIATGNEVQQSFQSFWDNGQYVEIEDHDNQVINNNLHGPNRLGGIISWQGWDPADPTAGAHDDRIAGNKVYDHFRPPNTIEHSATIGAYSGWSNITIENNIIGSRRYGTAANPITIDGLQWASADGIQGLFWFGASPGPTETYKNITWRNNVCMMGDSSSWFQKHNNANTDGIYFYNNTFYVNNGTYWFDAANSPSDSTGTDTNLYSRNNIFIGSGGINFGTITGTSTSDHNYTISDVNNLSNYFINPDVSINTYYGVNADWHLKTSAAALIDKGIDHATDGNVPLLDAAGLARLDATDIGAYEYQGSVSAPVASITKGTLSKPFLMSVSTNKLTLDVTLKDASSNNLSARSISVSGQRAGDTVTPSASTTDSNGKITYTISATTVGTLTLTFSSEGQTQTQAITVVKPGNINYLTNPDPTLNKVNYLDAAIFMARWGKTTFTDDYDKLADIYTDGKIDYRDAAILMANWGS